MFLLADLRDDKRPHEMVIVLLEHARRLAEWLSRPLRRLLIRHVPVDDAWEPVTSLGVTPHVFGPGSYRTFQWYFEGRSTVDVSSVEDVCRWLTQCEYVHDEDLFNDADFWQHPRTFEHLRKGDCEDHAIWAWRKLSELGHDAVLFVGRWFADGDDLSRHAWVVFERNGQRFLVEPVLKDEAAMVRPLGDARADYLPHFSVDSTFTMRGHAGYLLYLKARERRERERRLE
jgi:hypothetical protein